MQPFDPQLLYDEDHDRFEVGVAEAVHGDVAGDEALVRALASAEGGRRVILAAALGEAEGPYGLGALQALVLDADEVADARSAGLVALSKRQGVAASAILATCLDDQHPSVRRYALKCLACVGDDRGWTEVHGRLREMLGGSPPRHPKAMNAQALSLQSDNIAAIGYLARHLTTVERRAALVGAILDGWERLYRAEQDWLVEYWQASTPANGGAGPDPNVDEITAWLCHPLMSALYEY